MNKDYKKLLEELYKENQSFLNKAIFGVSTLAVPFLFQVLQDDKVFFWPKILLWLSLLGFFSVIILQTFSLKSARDGCDKSLENNHADAKTGERLFLRARLLDKWREGIFIFSLFLIVGAMIFNILQKELIMTQGKDGKGQVMIGQDSFTPPKAMVRQSFVPPQASVSQNKPATPPASTTPQGQTSSSGGNQGKTK